MSVETTRIEDLGRELGEAIASTDEYNTFEEAKENVENSEEAQAQIEQFESIRQEFMLARQTGDVSQEDVQKIQEAQQDLHSIPVMAEYLEAQEALSDRLETVNEAISAPLDLDFGEEAGGCCQD